MPQISNTDPNTKADILSTLYYILIKGKLYVWAFAHPGFDVWCIVNLLVETGILKNENIMIPSTIMIMLTGKSLKTETKIETKQYLKMKRNRHGNNNDKIKTGCKSVFVFVLSTKLAQTQLADDTIVYLSKYNSTDVLKPLTSCHYTEWVNITYIPL